jgi:hypothetical protein
VVVVLAKAVAVAGGGVVVAVEVLEWCGKCKGHVPASGLI